MSTNEEVTEQEAYHEIMEYLRKKEEQLAGELARMQGEIEQLEESFKKIPKDTSKGEIMGYCKECRHPLTNTEIKEEPVCPYCRKTSKYTTITEKDE